jgi:hypothetical protein
LHGAHDGTGIPPKLLHALLVGLACGFELGLKIGPILREGGGEMATPVAMNRAFAKAILPRNVSDRLPGDEPIVNDVPGRMDTNGAQTRH